MELTLDEVATLLGKSDRQIRYMIEQETLPAVKKGKRWMIREEDIPQSHKQSYVANQRKKRF